MISASSKFLGIDGEGEQQPRIARGAGTLVESGADGIDGVAAYGPSATPAMQYRRAREQELQVVVELRHGAHGRAEVRTGFV